MGRRLLASFGIETYANGYMRRVPKDPFRTPSAYYKMPLFVTGPFGPKPRKSFGVDELTGDGSEVFSVRDSPSDAQMAA